MRVALWLFLKVLSPFMGFFRGAPSKLDEEFVSKAYRFVKRGDFIFAGRFLDARNYTSASKNDSRLPYIAVSLSGGKVLTDDFKVEELSEYLYRFDKVRVDRVRTGNRNVIVDAFSKLAEKRLVREARLPKDRETVLVK